MVELSDRNFQARAEYLHGIAHESIGSLSGERCLMIGSGTGHNTVEFSTDFTDVHALDIVPREFPDVVDHRLIADGTRLPYDDDTFDLTVAISVVEHVLPPSNRKNLVEEMARCTAPGGHLFFQIPNGRFPLELHTGLPFIHWVPGGKEFAIRRGHTTLKRVHIPSRSTLEGWVREAGGDVVASKGIVYPPEAIPKYRGLYRLLRSMGLFRVFPFGHVVVGTI
jgi:SAM-dependent methyltransferase